MIVNFAAPFSFTFALLHVIATNVLYVQLESLSTSTLISPGDTYQSPRPQSLNDHVQRSVQCCMSHFKRPGRQCFDLGQCSSTRVHVQNAGNGVYIRVSRAALVQPIYAYLFGHPRHADTEQVAMCTCMKGVDWERLGYTAHPGAGGPSPSVCCENKFQSTIKVQQPKPKPPSNQNRTVLKKIRPVKTSSNTSKPPGSPSLKPLVNNISSSQVSQAKEDTSIYSLEWTPSTKSAVLSHRNVHLLPKLDSCGVASAVEGTLASYIIGGTNSRFGAHPWMALIGIECTDPTAASGELPQFAFACGGTLINSRYVLTAAHCVVSRPNPSSTSTDPQCKATVVRLGEYDQSTDPDCDPSTVTTPKKTVCAPSAQNVTISEVVAHVNFSFVNQENDIALIRLARPVTLGAADPFVSPICLPIHDFVKSSTNLVQSNLEDEADMLTVAGWGRTAPHAEEETPDILQQVRVPIVNRTRCQAYFGPDNKGIGVTRFCAGGERSRDSCNGDSGGPIMGRVTMEPSLGRGGQQGAQAKMVQLGIVSIGRSVSNCSTAGDGHFTLYTKVAHFLPWILDNIKP